MKELLIETKNVVRADRALKRLGEKDSSGLVLVYGETGNGKTFWTEKRTFSHGWLYYRLTAADASRSFLRQMYKRLNRKFTGSNEIISGSSARIEQECIDMIRLMPDLVIVVDEVNLAVQFRKWEIIEVLRDFKDIADATIVMVGEHDTRDRLEAYNRHFFNRCEFVKFGLNSAEDVAKVVAGTSEVKLCKDLYTQIVKKTNGNLREAANLVREFEAVARDRGLTELTMENMK